MKKIYIAMLAAAVLAGCSKNEEGDGSETPQGGERAIVIASSIEAEGRTKAAVENGSALTEVQFLRQDVNGTTPPTTYTGITAIEGSRAVDGTITFAAGSVPTYNKNNYNAYFVAYWPKQAPVNEIVTWPVDGTTDILLTPAYNAGTYAAPLTGGGGANGTAMQFKHKLAQLEVICIADDDADVSEDAVQETWGKITKVEILESNSQAKFDYTGPGGVTYDTPAAIALVQSDYATGFPAAGIELLKTPNPVITAAGMFAPDVTAGSTAPVKLKIYTEKVTEGKEVSVQLKSSAPSSENKPFEVGKKHTATLKFKASSLDVEILSTTIDTWDTGYTGSTDVEK